MCVGQRGCNRSMRKSLDGINWFRSAKARFRSSQSGLGPYSDWRISMKNWSRVLLLAGVLTMTSFAVVEADPWQVNTCYILCDGTQYIVPGNSLWECCAGTY